MNTLWTRSDCSLPSCLGQSASTFPARPAISSEGTPERRALSGFDKWSCQGRHSEGPHWRAAQRQIAPRAGALRTAEAGYWRSLAGSLAWTNDGPVMNLYLTGPSIPLSSHPARG